MPSVITILPFDADLSKWNISGKKKGKYSNKTKSREKKLTKIKAENTTFEKDILISLENLVVFSV